MLLYYPGGITFQEKNRKRRDRGIQNHTLYIGYNLALKYFKCKRYIINQAVSNSHCELKERYSEHIVL